MLNRFGKHACIYLGYWIFRKQLTPPERKKRKRIWKGRATNRQTIENAKVLPIHFHYDWSSFQSDIALV